MRGLGWSRPIVLRQEASATSYVAQPASKQAPTVAFAANHALIAALARRQSSLTVEDLEASEDAVEQQAGAACREHGWDVCVPIVVDGGVHTLLAFHRQEQAQATASDLEILDALAALAASAMARARLQNELQFSQETIRRAERLSSLGTLSASIAHEIRNQMVAIQTFLQLLPNRLHDQEFLTSFLALANEEVARIATLVGELLAFARSSDRGVAREDVNHLIERSITILQPEAKRRQISLRQDLDAEVPDLFANGDKINQVLTNLILNGIQATPAGGTVSITTRARRLGDVLRVRIEVKDSGPGIAADQLAQIFSPFFTTKPEGTGLGLAISRAIVIEHDGEIYVESDSGCGATFVVELPAASVSS